MRTVCIVQARMGSTRLPGKVLLPLNGHTVIEEVITRCRRIQGVDLVAVTTPDQEIWDFIAKRKLCPVYRWDGDEADVLARYYHTAISTDADLVMRVTSDCPLICSEVCAAVLNLRNLSDADYACNVEPRTFPRGYDCEVFTFDALRRAYLESHSDEREHVTTWMRAAPDLKRVNLTAPWQLDGRLTLDTEDDYRVICAAFGHEPYQGRMAA